MVDEKIHYTMTPNLLLALPPLEIPVSSSALELLLSSAYFLTSIYTSLLFLDIFTSIASPRTDSNTQTSFHGYTREFIPNVLFLLLFRRQSLHACFHLPLFFFASFALPIRVLFLPLLYSLLSSHLSWLPFLARINTWCWSKLCLILYDTNLEHLHLIALLNK